MSQENLVIVGYIASSETLNSLVIFNGYIAVQKGKIIKKGGRSEYDELNKAKFWQNYHIIKLSCGQILIPGLVDCHVHGPQFPNIGLGLDKPLLEWLEKYTFPLEKQYCNEEFSNKVYNQVVKRLLKNGTTTACYFGSLHYNGTMSLVNNIVKNGQRAMVGKVSMNIENNIGYYNNTEKELDETEKFLNEVFKLKNDLVEPVVTPRFVLSCDSYLLGQLGQLAEKYNCKIQSHISENLSEVACVLQTYSSAKSYAEVYDIGKLLTNKCIMAHAVHLSDDEIQLLEQRGVSVAHCPASNTRLMSGMCPLRKLINSNLTVGLGTDVAGGDSASIMDAMRRAMDVSSHLEIKGSAGATISWKEAFYLATLGGAKALNLDHKIGNFDIGKEFDALLVDAYRAGGPIDRFEYSSASGDAERAEHLLQRFIYLGDDRNIVQIYVQGALIDV